jgi:hypothetical protein
MAPALPEVERRTRASVGARSAVLRPTAARCMLPHRAPLRQLSELSSQFRQEQKAYSQRLQAPSPSSPARSRPRVHSTAGSAPSAFSLRLRMDARGPSHASAVHGGRAMYESQHAAWRCTHTRSPVHARTQAAVVQGQQRQTEGYRYSRPQDARTYACARVCVRACAPACKHARVFVCAPSLVPSFRACRAQACLRVRSNRSPDAPSAQRHATRAAARAWSARRTRATPARSASRRSSCC